MYEYGIIWFTTGKTDQHGWYIFSHTTGETHQHGQFTGSLVYGQGTPFIVRLRGCVHGGGRCKMPEPGCIVIRAEITVVWVARVRRRGNEDIVRCR